MHKDDEGINVGFYSPRISFHGEFLSRITLRGGDRGLPVRTVEDLPDSLATRCEEFTAKIQAALPEILRSGTRKVGN